MNKIKVYIVGFDHDIDRMYRQRGYEIVDSIHKADIVQFIGGADVNPELYGERLITGTHCDFHADKRDKTAWDASADKMKVGICRGGQFVNVMNGGRMWQHVEGHNRGVHAISDLLFSTDRDNLDEISVTSTHHQMMIPSAKGELLAFGNNIAYGHKSNGGSTPTKVDAEVVWYSDTKSLCFQPHPEYRGHPECTDYFFKLIDFFYEEKE